MCNKTSVNETVPVSSLRAGSVCSDMSRCASPRLRPGHVLQLDAQSVGTGLHPSHRRCVITISLATVMTTFQHCIQTESGCRQEARTDTQVSTPSSLNLNDSDSRIFTNPGELEVLTRYLLMNENYTKMSPGQDDHKLFLGLQCFSLSACNASRTPKSLVCASTTVITQHREIRERPLMCRLR